MVSTDAELSMDASILTIGILLASPSLFLRLPIVPGPACSHDGACESVFPSSIHLLMWCSTSSKLFANTDCSAMQWIISSNLVWSPLTRSSYPWTKRRSWPLDPLSCYAFCNFKDLDKYQHCIPLPGMHPLQVFLPLPGWCSQKLPRMVIYLDLHKKVNLLKRQATWCRHLAPVHSFYLLIQENNPSWFNHAIGAKVYFLCMHPTVAQASEFFFIQENSYHNMSNPKNIILDCSL